MDMRKAFDTIDHPALIEALRSKGLLDAYIALLRMRWDGHIHSFCFKIWPRLRGRHWFDILCHHDVAVYEDEYVFYIANLQRIELKKISLVVARRVFCVSNLASIVVVSFIDSNAYNTLSCRA